MFAFASTALVLLIGAQLHGLSLFAEASSLIPWECTLDD